jgi:hypothetical protein
MYLKRKELCLKEKLELMNESASKSQSKLSLTGRINFQNFCLSSYDKKGIYNMDETGLFYRVLPDESFSISGEECKGVIAQKK